MSIHIKFDTANRPEFPTLIIVTQNGDKVGVIRNAEGFRIKDNMNSASELYFSVHKYYDGQKYRYWDQIKNFRLIYAVEWRKYFIMKVSIDESYETIKNITCTSLQEYELSQLRLYDMEVNTEADITRKDYIPTILYDVNDNASLLTRMLKDKASHYTIIHVDESLQKLQRTFSFDDISIYDGFMEIEEELNCLFVFGEETANNSQVYSNTDCTIPILYGDINEENFEFVFSDTSEDFSLMRTISVYDLESNCKDCGHRGEFTYKCPKCGSHNITEGYGDDTTIFVNSENLTEDLNLTCDTDSVKNCFRLEAGDDLMTATIMNMNPSGSQYIWYFSDEMKIDMSEELRNKIISYDVDYEYFQNEYIATIDTKIIQKYNQLIQKYKMFDEELEEVTVPIKGYSNLIKTYYDIIDFHGYLKDSLMPSVKIDDTNAEEQAKLLTSKTMSPVSVQNSNYVSLATANSTITAYAKVMIDTSKYKIKVKTSTLEGLNWTGVLTLENYYDENDIADTTLLQILINGDYENFIKQKIDKTLAKSKDNDLSIVGLFKLDDVKFKAELKKYSYTYLQLIDESCQSCLDILIEQGDSSENNWKYTEGNIYKDIYLPLYNKKTFINDELIIRESELEVIAGRIDEYGDVKVKGLKNYIEDIKNSISNKLDFQTYIGEHIGELNMFRREDTWRNDNYISEGLSNHEIFENAKKFLEEANKNIAKASHINCSISTTLKNFLLIKVFQPMVYHFKIGNWIRVQIDDEIYKLRLLSYELDYGNLDYLPVEFSNTCKVLGVVNDIENIIAQSKSMSKSYSATKRQAEQGSSAKNIIEEWIANGINITKTSLGDKNPIVFDEHGVLFRKYDEELGDYSPAQIKIVNNVMSTTRNNWKSTDAAIGEFEYYNPKTQRMETGYGLIAQQIVGGLMLSSEIGIYNKNGTMTFDDANGLNITNGINTFNVNPNEKSLLSIKKGNVMVFGVSDTGELTFTGNVIANDLTLGSKGLYENNGKTSISISPKDISILTLQKDMEKVLYFDKNGDLNIKAKLTAQALNIESDSGIYIDVDNITGIENYVRKDLVIGSNPTPIGKIGTLIHSNGEFKTNGAEIYNPIIYSGARTLSGEDSMFKLTPSGHVEMNDCLIKKGGFTIEDNESKQILSISNVTGDLNILDAWGNKGNIISSGDTEKIKVTVNGNFLEFWVGTTLFATVPKKNSIIDMEVSF